MIIAAFGVYVLAADAVQRCTPEIALRKLFGTRRRDIGTAVLLSAAVGLALAALAIGRYLAVYTERTPFAYCALAFTLWASVAGGATAVARRDVRVQTGNSSGMQQTGRL